MRFVLLLTTLFFVSTPALATEGDFAALTSRIENGDFDKIAALAIEQGGETVYRKRFKKGEPGDPVDIRSAGKSITALAVHAAIADGALPGVETLVWPYLGSERGEPHDAITVGDLLSMASALDCNDWERKSPGQEERMYRKRVWRDFALALPADSEFARRPGGQGRFSYCTAGVFLLGQVVQTATGERFDTYVQRRLFDPLDIDSAIWRTSRSGEIQSGGQLRIADSDLLKLGRLMLNRGKWNGVEVLPESAVSTILSPTNQLGEHVYYGQLWWAIPLKSPRGFEAAWMMKGNGGNHVAIVPSYDAVIVVQAENYNKSDAERHAFDIMWAALAALPPPE